MNRIQFKGDLQVISFPINDEELLKKFPFDMLLQKNIYDLRQQNYLIVSYYVESMPDTDINFPYCTSRLSFQVILLPNPQRSKIIIKKKNLGIDL